MKKIVIVLGIISAFLLTTTTVLAYNQHTGYFIGPEAQINQTHESAVYSLSSAKAPITGAECEVWYNSFGWLHDNMVSWDDRTATVMLMEQDGSFGGGDDQVKQYTVEFTGLHMDNVFVADTINEGNIESSGDAKAELYLTLRLHTTSGDSEDSNGAIFYSDIRVN